MRQNGPPEDPTVAASKKWCEVLQEKVGHQAHSLRQYQAEISLFSERSSGLMATGSATPGHNLGYAVGAMGAHNEISNYLRFCNYCGSDIVFDTISQRNSKIWSAMP